jgi:hypothetical protein
LPYINGCLQYNPCSYIQIAVYIGPYNLSEVFITNRIYLVVIILCSVFLQEGFVMSYDSGEGMRILNFYFIQLHAILGKVNKDSYHIM